MKIITDSCNAVSAVRGKTTYTRTGYKFTYRMTDKVEEECRKSWADGYSGATMHDAGYLLSDTELSDAEVLKYVVSKMKKYNVHGDLIIEHNGTEIYKTLL